MRNRMIYIVDKGQDNDHLLKDADLALLIVRYVYVCLNYFIFPSMKYDPGPGLKFIGLLKSILLLEQKLLRAQLTLFFISFTLQSPRQLERFPNRSYFNYNFSGFVYTLFQVLLNDSFALIFLSKLEGTKRLLIAFCARKVTSSICLLKFIGKIQGLQNYVNIFLGLLTSSLQQILPYENLFALSIMVLCLEFLRVHGDQFQSRLFLSLLLNFIFIYIQLQLCLLMPQGQNAVYYATHCHSFIWVIIFVINLSMSQNSKFKVKEFEWFEMETKVRQIIQEVLGPMQKRILETSNILHKVKINQSQDEDKISQITLMIANDPKVFQTGIFQTVDHRFQEQTKHIEELSRQIKQSSKYVDEKFKILDIRMEESSEVLRNVASLRERISKEIQLQNDNINQLRTNLTQMIENLSLQIRENRKIIQNNYQISQKQNLLTNEKIRNIDIKIENIDAVLDNHRQMHRQKSMKIEEYGELLNKHREEINALQQSKHLTKKLQEYVKQMDNELARAQFKIDNISPLITQAQISDCLFNVLPPKLKKKITIHQYKKYYQLNRQVLQKPYKQVKEKFASIQLLEQMQKRNTKQIVQLKRKKLLSMGIDIDHLTYEQRQRYYNEVDLDEAIDDEDDEVKVSNKVDQKQILNLITVYFNEFTNTVNEKVKLELEDSKKYVYALEEELRHQLSTYEGKYSTIKKECQTFHTEQLLQNKTFSEQYKQTNKTIGKLKTEFNNFKDLQRLFYNFCSLVNHLEIQDQIDKQNISLMGVQQNNSQNPAHIKEKNSILQLDKKCFSCCGYPASTLSAFKMACLTYNPSSIKIDSKEYKREELLEFTTNMLHNIKKCIQADPTEKQPIFNRHTLEHTIDRPYYDTTEQIKQSHKVDTQQQESAKKSNNNRFRKTKKNLSINTNPNSVSKYQSKTKSKNITTMNEDMMNVSTAFTQLKRRNISFLC